jgi:methylenetetrahydrofolate dehydrogenase (NADP+)/methenyltetrahydrofolate cyclohydrolase
MAELYKGAPVAAALNEKTTTGVQALKEKGIVPTLAIVQVGEKGADTAYANSAKKRCAKFEIETRHICLPEDISQDGLLRTIESLNNDVNVPGILLLRPCPPHR